MNHPRINTIKNELQSCESLILSFPRSGRTWMRFFVGHYIEKKYDVKFTKFLERQRGDAPRISLRHDFMSTTGHIPWKDYFEIQNKNQFIFTNEIKTKKMVYLFRNPIDVLFSYMPYLASSPYDNFVPKQYKDIIDFANDPKWGMQIILNFMNNMIQHYHDHKGEKFVIKYEEMKNKPQVWIDLLEFLMGDIDHKALKYAKEMTNWNKMQEKNDSSKPKEIRFFRRGESNYIDEANQDQQKILLNWPGLGNLIERIKKL